MSPISIDTSKAEVARAAIEAGASIVNDVTGGRGDERMLPLIAETKVGLHHHAHARNSAHDADRAAIYMTLSKKFPIFFDNNMRAP